MCCIEFNSWYHDKEEKQVTRLPLSDSCLYSVFVKLHFCVGDVWIQSILQVFRQCVCLKRDWEMEIIRFVTSNCQSVMWYVFNLRWMRGWVVALRGLLMTHRAESKAWLFNLIEIWLLGRSAFLLGSSTGRVGLVKENTRADISGG